MVETCQKNVVAFVRACVYARVPISFVGFLNSIISHLKQSSLMTILISFKLILFLHFLLLLIINEQPFKNFCRALVLGADGTSL